MPQALSVSHWPWKLWRPCRPEDRQKYLNCRPCKSIACLNSRKQCNSHKLLPVKQDLQIFHLPVHPLYCQRGAEDLKVSWRLDSIEMKETLYNLFLMGVAVATLTKKVHTTWTKLSLNFGGGLVKFRLTSLRSKVATGVWYVKLEQKILRKGKRFCRHDLTLWFSPF